MEEYASFACPGCESFHRDSFDAVLERVKTGQVLFTYVPLNTGSIPNAPGASRAALCAGQQGMFWEMHDVLFDWQTLYGNTAFSQNRLLTGVERLGLDSPAFTACFNSAGISRMLDAAANEGVSTTPTLRVNGVTVAASQAGTIPGGGHDSPGDRRCHSRWLGADEYAHDAARRRRANGQRAGGRYCLRHRQHSADWNCDPGGCSVRDCGGDCLNTCARGNCDPITGNRVAAPRGRVYFGASIGPRLRPPSKCMCR